MIINEMDQITLRKKSHFLNREILPYSQVISCYRISCIEKFNHKL